MSYIEAKRDVKINGVVNIHSNNIYKPLNQLNNEELITEEKHRRKLLKKEKKKKMESLKFCAIISLAIGILLFIYFFFSGMEIKLSASIVITFPVTAILLSVYEMSKHDEFETRQQTALKEIVMLLREREVR